MRRLAVLCLVAALMAALAPMGRSDTSALMLVEARPENERERAYLLSSFDETHNHSGGRVELLLWPGDAVRLEATGIDYEVVVADVAARDAALAELPKPLVELPGPDRTDYRRLDDYNSEMKKLAEKNPQLVRLIKMPHRTREGRRVLALEIAANVDNRDGRPTLYIDGIHHAREWPAAEYPMIYAHHLVERFKEHATVTRLLRDLRVLIVPIVNPDGFDYSRESPVQNPLLGIAGLEGYWRKNRRSLTGATAPVVQRNPDAYGVDPNRNYGFMWGDRAGGSSGVAADQTYRGDLPFSEPESRNVRRTILGRHVTGVITNHTYGNLVLRPWGHTAEDAPDERFLASLGERLADAMGGYENQRGIELYATTGTTDDWAYAATGALGYTFEHGDAFHPPFASGVGAQFRGVIDAYMLMAAAVAEPRRHSVIQGRVVARSGDPVEARLSLTKTAKTPLGKGNPSGRKSIEDRLSTRMNTQSNGRFEWHVNPSTRPVAKQKERYRLSISSRRGCAGRTIVIERGQTIDLGDITLGSLCSVSARILPLEVDPFP